MNEELFYKLQWKQLHGVTDPEMLNFKDFKNRLHQSERLMTDFTKFETATKQELNTLTENFTKSISTCNLLMGKLKWFEELSGIKSLHFETLLEELTKSKLDTLKLLEVVKGGNKEEVQKNYLVSIVRLGRHNYFPGVKLNKKIDHHDKGHDRKPT